MPASERTILALLTLPLLGWALAGASPDSPAPVKPLQQALAALDAQQPAEALELAGPLADAGGKDAPAALLVVATARQRLGDFEQAVAAYKRCLEACRPAQREYVTEQLRLCEGELAGPAMLLPPSKYITGDERRKLAKVDKAESVETTDHFVVTARNSGVAKLVAAQAETCLTRICRTLYASETYPHSVNIYVWPDITEYRKHAVNAPEWSAGSFTLKTTDNGQAIRRIDLMQLDEGRCFDVTLLDSILPHEMCHLVTTEFFGDTRAPLAINEGLAMLAESGSANARVVQAGSALAGDRKIAIADLLLARQCQHDTAGVFYAESYSLAAYLRSHLNTAQFRDMLTHVKNGCSLDVAVQRALCVSVEDGFMKKLAAAWEEDAIKQSQFLRALEPSALKPS
jgi:tetratricopeptide (TPR) repeat protein